MAGVLVLAGLNWSSCSPSLTTSAQTPNETSKPDWLDQDERPFKTRKPAWAGLNCFFQQGYDMLITLYNIYNYGKELIKVMIKPDMLHILILTDYIRPFQGRVR